MRVAGAVCALLATSMFAQRPAHFEHAAADFTHAHELFDMAKYGAAQYEMDRVRDRIRDQQDPIRTEAEFYSAICAVRLFHDDASKQIGRASCRERV